jgi:hypothetical protein
MPGGSVCTEDSFRANTAREDARHVGRIEAIRLIAAAKGLPESEAARQADVGPCAFKVQEFAAYKSMFAQQKVENAANEMWKPDPKRVIEMEGYEKQLKAGCS